MFAIKRPSGPTAQAGRLRHFPPSNVERAQRPRGAQPPARPSGGECGACVDVVCLPRPLNITSCAWARTPDVQAFICLPRPTSSSLIAGQRTTPRPLCPDESRDGIALPDSRPLLVELSRVCTTLYSRCSGRGGQLLTPPLPLSILMMKQITTQLTRLLGAYCARCLW